MDVYTNALSMHWSLHHIHLPLAANYHCKLALVHHPRQNRCRCVHADDSTYVWTRRNFVIYGHSNVTCRLLPILFSNNIWRGNIRSRYANVFCLAVDIERHPNLLWAIVYMELQWLSWWMIEISLLNKSGRGNRRCVSDNGEGWALSYSQSLAGVLAKSALRRLGRLIRRPLGAQVGGALAPRIS